MERAFAYICILLSHVVKFFMYVRVMTNGSSYSVSSPNFHDVSRACFDKL